MIDYAQGLGGKFTMVSGIGDHQTEGRHAYEAAAVSRRYLQDALGI